MPAENAVKTALAHKRRRRLPLIVLSGAVVLATALAGYYYSARCGGRYEDGKLVINGQSHQLEIAKDSAAQQKGLSGRRCMKAHHAMLFPFTETGTHCFWMKDMRFPIDIIWLNEAKEVVHIEHNVSPDSYPNSFCPDEAARYVLELKAVQAKRLGIEPGTAVNF